jgi:hypothetical protein
MTNNSSDKRRIIMNKKQIEQHLKAAPEPSAPDGLLDKLEADLTVRNIRKRRSALRRWFVPSGEFVSPLRVAAVVAIAAMVLLPLAYAGSKVIKSYLVEVNVIETIEGEDGSITKVGTASAIMVSPAGQTTEEEAKEIEELKKAGKFEKVLVEERVENGMVFRLYNVNYTLSSGKVISTNKVEAGTQ